MNATEMRHYIGVLIMSIYRNTNLPSHWETNALLPQNAMSFNTLKIIKKYVPFRSQYGQLIIQSYNHF